jgi:phosphoglycerate dehydrogenase-like enzyme
MTKILLAVTADNYGTVIPPDVESELLGLGDVVQRKDLGEPEAYHAAIAGVQPEVIVTGWGTATLTLDAYRSAPPLTYLCHCAGTVRRLIERDVLAAGLLVSNWGAIPARTVAEASLMMTLAALRRVSSCVRVMDGGGWGGDLRGATLFGRTVGLHGLGVIAQDFVRLLGPFGCPISAYSPHCPDEVFERLGVRRETDLRRLYAENDVVSIHASNTPENHHIVDAEMLASMKDGAVLVNTARGAIIDEAALPAELARGRIWAALDVYEIEPLPEDSPLRGMTNVLLMPHKGGPTQDERPRMGRHALANLKRYLAGEEVEDVVSLRKYDLIT